MFLLCSWALRLYQTPDKYSACALEGEGKASLTAFNRSTVKEGEINCDLTGN